GCTHGNATVRQLDLARVSVGIALGPRRLSNKQRHRVLLQIIQQKLRRGERGASYQYEQLPSCIDLWCSQQCAYERQPQLPVSTAIEPEINYKPIDLCGIDKGHQPI